MNDNKVKVNWLNVIFNSEFQDSLDKNTLINVSILSKLVREKLKPVLFKNIQLSSRKFQNEFKDNIFIEYFNCVADPDLYDSINREEEGEGIESGLEDFGFGLSSIKDIARSFYFSDLNRAGYYLISMFNSMSNLTILKLSYSFIPYSSFTKLGELLPNLKEIKLISATLAKLPANSIWLDNFVFPPNLNILEIYDCRVITSRLFLDPYEFLFNEFTRAPRIDFTLPNVQVPSLKKLSFFSYTAHDNGLKPFIETNSNLESLNTGIFHSDLVNSLTSLKTLEIDILSNLDDIDHIPILNCVKNLKIYTVSPRYYENIKKLCLICPNLQSLGLNMSYDDNFQHLINSFLAPIMANLHQLKTLRLHFIINETENINIENFSDIESIIIETKSTTILNLSFEGCKDLKRIIFKSYTGDINTQEFKDRFNSYKNWVFKFSTNTIRGHKLLKCPF
ncbi:hypothetical protein CONCODRAFT_20024 [Conidiobolus coronatus NRRL 28638]|uniref:RNI-like protein n=1 Tax=Conidiobolus coronatus (strain ATCC 28846 / CBS 209.66 / NRRL 28638) TaxID=796925 RepID=A0A137NW07_CONC2|nr:hypothetical protein CONCODRAFT_20024 [Conidiobolus coronatus NRRL 28638]|eukprot:KXN66819.1 hypothetical protein CONCODRAFT_20024 [Conidiobolus coronatus NRRL 28638]